jgi:hypothetical protein
MRAGATPVTATWTGEGEYDKTRVTSRSLRGVPGISRSP